MPVLSIIVPVFNTAEPLLRRALLSAAAVGTEGVCVEIVVVDDGSDPACHADIERTLDACGGPFVRVTLCRHGANAGLAAARNTGLVAATGRWILFLDSDDELVPEAVAAMLEALSDGPDPILCFQSGYVTADTDRPVPTPAHRALAEAMHTGPVTPATCPELALIPSSWSQAYRRDWLVALKIGYDPALRRWEDRPFLVATQLGEEATIRVFPRLVHRHSLDAAGSITKRVRDTSDSEMLLSHIDQVQALIDAAGLADSGYGAIHWWISLSRLLSVAGPGAAGDRAAMAAVRIAGAALVARAPRNPATGQLTPPHPVLPISRLPAPLRALLVLALARSRNPLAGLGLGVVFRLLDIRRRRGKTLPA